MTSALVGRIFVSLSADRARGPQARALKPNPARRIEEPALTKLTFEVPVIAAVA